jgi:hypothetical protein
MALVCVYVRKANYFQQGKYNLINRRAKKRPRMMNYARAKEFFGKCQSSEQKSADETRRAMVNFFQSSLKETLSRFFERNNFSRAYQRRKKMEIYHFFLAPNKKN